MDLKQLLENLSHDLNIPLQKTEKGTRLQGDVYQIDCTHNFGRDNIAYVDKISRCHILGTPQPLLYYIVQEAFLDGRITLLKATQTQIGTKLAEELQKPQELDPAMPPSELLKADPFYANRYAELKEFEPDELPLFIKRHILH